MACSDLATKAVFMTGAGGGRRTCLQAGLTVVIALALMTPIVAQVCVPAPAGLIAWWPGDGDTADIAGGNDGTLQDGATFVAGHVGEAFHFDGVNDSVVVPDAPDLAFGTGDFTIAFWVKFDELNNNDTGMMSKDTFSGDLNTNTGWVFNVCDLCGGGAFGAGTGGLGFETRNRAGGAGPWTHARYATSNFATGTWYYLAGVRQANVLRLYVDGVLRATTTEATPTNIDNNGQMKIGALNPGTQFMAGDIDELDIYNRALSQSEIQTIFDAGSDGKCKAAEPPANLQISAIKAPPAAAPGATISVRDTTLNAGTGAAAATTNRIWLSTNKMLGAGDVPLADRGVPGLAPSTKNTLTTSVPLPVVAPGSYFLLVEADAADDAAESSEADNIKAKAISLGPDLTIASMVFDPASPTSSAPTTITLTLKNKGGSNAGASVTRLYRSANGKLDAGDVPLAELPSSGVAAGGMEIQVRSLTLPAGTYYVLAVCDASSLIGESKETNNLAKALKTIP
jgi:Concanavalin A-like lectin/glucanases superfamily/CARDB